MDIKELAIKVFVVVVSVVVTAAVLNPSIFTITAANDKKEKKKMSINLEANAGGTALKVASFTNRRCKEDDKEKEGCFRPPHRGHFFVSACFRFPSFSRGEG